MRKRILITVPENKLKPIGGPYGYLYNLKQGLDNLDIEMGLEVNFYRAGENIGESKNIIKNFLHRHYAFFLLMKIMFSNFLPKQNFSEYDLLHFHQTLDLFFCRKSLKGYKGKIVLTSHSPEVWHKEFLDFSDFKSGIVRNIVARVDDFSFRKADYVFFPCCGAEEPYYNSWDKYSKIRESKNIKYIATGIKQCTAKKKSDEIRDKYNIPRDVKLICYVGRHNEIKGYDLLKKSFEKYLKKDGYYIIVAGKEESLSGFKEDKQWIEVGWTSDPHSIINASDLFILPNRETYFDLIALEVLSLGKCILMSDTGGNTYFKEFHSPGIIYFEPGDVNGIYQSIRMFFNDEKNKIHGEEQNLDIYENHFTETIFAKNYLELLNGIIKEETNIDIGDCNING